MIVNGFPKTCHEVQSLGGQEGYHTLDPEQDGLDPLSVFCNMSSTPITAVLHHNLEEWVFVKGYEATGSYNGQVSSKRHLGHRNRKPVHPTFIKWIVQEPWNTAGSNLAGYILT